MEKLVIYKDKKFNVKADDIVMKNKSNLGENVTPNHDKTIANRNK